MENDFRQEVIDFIGEQLANTKMGVHYRVEQNLDDEIRIGEKNLVIRTHSHKTHSSNFINAIEKQPICDTNKDFVVHLWEDQWLYQNEKIRSKLRSLLGLTKRIYARETQLVDIDNTSLLNFLDEHHLNVAIKGKFKYGLIYNGQIVAVISLSKGRPMQRDGVEYISFELLRFCNRLNTTVVGGFSKLLHHFIKSQNPDDIMTYVDADWSEGRSLLGQGFSCVGFKEPEEFWLNSVTYTREYPKLVLQQHPELSTKSEGDLKTALQSMGYFSVTNSGSYKFLRKMK